MRLYGISYDTPEDNRRWSEMMGFAFPLLSDPDHEVGRMMDVERDPDERGYGVPRRVTYVIDPGGVIKASYLVGREEIADHADVVLDDLRARLRK